MSWITEDLKIALGSIRANKGRALLTVLGIIIGIAAVIAMLSVGEGAQATITDQVQGLGSNTINVFAVADFGGFTSRSGIQSLFSSKLDHEILDVLDNEIKFKEVTALAPNTSTSSEIIYRSRSKSSSVYGVPAVYFDIRNMNIQQGEAFTDRDDRNQSKVAVLGSDIAGKLFGENNPVGTDIKIDGSNYLVLGVIEEKGGDFDENVYVPFNTATNYITGSKDFSQLTIAVADEDVVDSVALKIEEALRDYYRLGEDEDANFSVITSSDILELTQTITGVFTTLLASIAGISLVVGGIGIMNIMLVSVSERTKEIGLRKAVGAKQRAILSQFLMESIVLTMLGGIIGVLFGSAMALLIGNLGDIPTTISLNAVTLATTVSITIGVVFGFYPAYQASKLNPIEALRYE